MHSLILQPQSTMVRLTDPKEGLVAHKIQFMSNLTSPVTRLDQCKGI